MAAAAQGDLLELARELREEGMARTQAADDDRGGWDTKVIDQAIEHLIATGERWSANTLRDLLPQVRQPLIGKRISSFAGRKRIKRVGGEPSNLPSTHLKEIAVWIGINAQEPS